MKEAVSCSWVCISVLHSGLLFFLQRERRPPLRVNVVFRMNQYGGGGRGGGGGGVFGRDEGTPPMIPWSYQCSVLTLMMVLSLALSLSRSLSLFLPSSCGSDWIVSELQDVGALAVFSILGLSAAVMSSENEHKNRTRTSAAPVMQMAPFNGDASNPTSFRHLLWGFEVTAELFHMALRPPSCLPALWGVLLLFSALLPAKLLLQL